MQNKKLKIKMTTINYYLKKKLIVKIIKKNK